MPMNSDEAGAQRYLGGLEARIGGVETRVGGMEATINARLDRQDKTLDEILFLLRVWRGFWRGLAKASAIAGALAAAVYYGMHDWHGGQ